MTSAPPGTRPSLHTDDGRLVAAVTVRYDTDFRAGGIAEQDPDSWWQAVCRAGRELLARSGTSRERISVIGFSGQMMGAVLLDHAHRPVRPAMIWADHRSAEQARTPATGLGEERAYRLLGHRIHPTYSLTKAMWVRDNEPRTFRRVAHVCLAKDYIVQRLTGTLATDPSDASSTDAFDQRAGIWSRAVLDAAAIDPGLLPDIVESTSVVGRVRAHVADAWEARVRRRRVVGEANSLGAAGTAAVGSGLVDGFEVARELSTLEAEFTPSADRHRHYTARHREFLDAYRGLEPWFARERCATAPDTGSHRPS